MSANSGCSAQVSLIQSCLQGLRAATMQTRAVSRALHNLQQEHQEANHAILFEMRSIGKVRKPHKAAAHALVGWPPALQVFTIAG